ncbi:MAG: hypothetical protein KatS3mg033_0020 [Thermonema sp.]|uniref:hypothetical protein n=1 Tax=Thermonema sp. TaxID=2231181 RepID=UPI0021DD91FF|nr:hypothetical protein [Thermonema sp.]GIV38220.1 MAG: hypothetical protein KatS3mg033_0020 [Thermonema sp.]
MKHTRILILMVLALLWTHGSYGQYLNKQLWGSASLAAGAQQWSADAAIFKMHPLFGTSWLEAGYGLRATFFSGKERYFETADASLRQDAANIDSLYIESASVGALNAFVLIEARPLEKWRVGFNIDLGGFSVGGRRNAAYRAQGSNQTVPVSASPTAFNILLVGDRDIGTLNSNFYVTYDIAGRWRLRAAYQYLFVEYTTEAPLRNDNDRFRYKASMVSVAVIKRLSKN